MNFLFQDLAQQEEKQQCRKRYNTYQIQNRVVKINTLELSWESASGKLTSSMMSASPAENMRTGMSLSCRKIIKDDLDDIEKI